MERPATDKPRAVLAIPPRSILRDELRLARLEQYLEAEFLDLSFVLATESRNASDAPAAGVMPAKEGTPRLPAEESQTILQKVVDAIALFADYGQACSMTTLAVRTRPAWTASFRSRGRPAPERSSLEKHQSIKQRSRSSTRAPGD